MVKSSLQEMLEADGWGLLGNFALEEVVTRKSLYNKYMKKYDFLRIEYAFDKVGEPFPLNTYAAVYVKGRERS